KLAQTSPPIFDFRDGYEYNNHMFNLAASVYDSLLELHNHEALETLLDERVFRFLGMDSASTNWHHISRTENFAMPHVAEIGTRSHVYAREINEAVYANGRGAGAVAVSMHDYSKWLRHILHMYKAEESITPFVTKSNFDNMFTPHNVAGASGPFNLAAAYGLGVVVATYREKKMVTHSGALFGHYSWQCVFPDDGVAIAFFVNSDFTFPPSCGDFADLALFGEADGKQVSKAIADTRTAVSNHKKAVAMAEAARKNGTTPSLPLPSYEGVFSIKGEPFFLSARVSVTSHDPILLFIQPDDALSSAVPAVSKTLCHWQDNVFAALDVDGKPNPEWRVEAMVTNGTVTGFQLLP
ncbi:hypothetical protein HDU91_004602, partial [Kappamyces sp. JEL0680]